MPIHPKAVMPGTAGHVDFDDSIQWRAIQESEGIVTVIDRIAMDVVQVEQQVAVASLHDRVQQTQVVANLRVGRQVAGLSEAFWLDASGDWRLPVKEIES